MRVGCNTSAFLGVLPVTFFVERSFFLSMGTWTAEMLHGALKQINVCLYLSLDCMSSLIYDYEYA